jgi:hypothetical protein
MPCGTHSAYRPRLEPVEARLLPGETIGMLLLTPWNLDLTRITAAPSSPTVILDASPVLPTKAREGEGAVAPEISSAVVQPVSPSAQKVVDATHQEGLTDTVAISSTLAGPSAMDEGQIYVLAIGEVTFARAASGPWMDVQTGDLAWMFFAVPETGEVIEPGRAEGYGIFRDSFFMVINDIALGLRPGPVQPSVTVTNDYPVADALVIGPFIPLDSPGYGLEFELHDSTGTAWSSPTLAELFGIYGAELYDSIDWLAPAPGGGIGVRMTELLVFADP